MEPIVHSGDGAGPTNTLLVSSDEHTRAVLGCYGNEVVDTPNLDALAERGTTFLNAYANSPVCVPSRASLATGRFPHEVESYDNCSPYTGEGAKSWSHVLRDAGHDVAAAGKLHYRSPDDDTGFTDQLGTMHVKDGTGDLYGILRSKMAPRGEVREEIMRAGPGVSDYAVYDELTTRRAIDWIRARRSADMPWAMYVSLVCPHPPFISPPDDYARYDGVELPEPIQGRWEDWPDHPQLLRQRLLHDTQRPLDEEVVRRAVQAYYGLVTFVDRQVGRLLEVLAESGQSDRTRVIYTTDHGEMLGGHGAWLKGLMYEGSAGVPLIVAGPGVPEGRRTATNVSLVDVFPTMIHSTTGRAPAHAGLRGRSLLTLATEADHDREVFSEYHGTFSSSGIFMLRAGRHKYVHYVGMRPQLFDLQDDPREEIDLAASPGHASLVESMERRLRELVDPDAIDAAAKARQHELLERAGGARRVFDSGSSMLFSPSPAHTQGADHVTS